MCVNQISLRSPPSLSVLSSASILPSPQALAHPRTLVLTPALTYALRIEGAGVVRISERRVSECDREREDEKERG